MLSYEAALKERYAAAQVRLGKWRGQMVVSRDAFPALIPRPELPAPRPKRKPKPRKPKAEQYAPVAAPTRSRRPWRPLIWAILARHGTNMVEVQGTVRVSAVVTARRSIALLLRERGWSTPQIGKLLCKDHATILNLLHPERRAASKRERQHNMVKNGLTPAGDDRA